MTLRKKRCISVIVSICMLFCGLFSIKMESKADSGSGYEYCTDDGFAYLPIKDGMQIMGYIGNESDIIIPSEINGDPVKSIWMLVTDDNRELIRSVHIPNGITKISAIAFKNCQSLESIYIPASVTTVNSSNATDPYRNPFQGCPKLRNITVDEGNQVYSVHDGMLLSKDGTVLVSCQTKEEYDIPSQITRIASGAFSGNENLKKVVIPDGISKIENTTFTGCTSLTDVTIPDSVTEISFQAFNVCSSLENIQLPKNLTVIEEGLFAGCRKLDHVVIPSGVTTIEASAFLGCDSLKTIVIPASVNEIGPDSYSIGQIPGLTLRENLIVYGDTGSYAETYCAENNISFLPMGFVENPFTDVSVGKYYTAAVLWAYHSVPQITTGTGETTFEPKKICDRAQVVTFIWRMMGCPEPKTTNNPFKDVISSAYYYKAVLWAVEINISTGKYPDRFAPKDPCTRAQFVTFFWRACGSPAPQGTNNPFVDVKAGKYYTNAVIWANEKGITTGTDDTHFSPGVNVNRGQAVTFLYRGRNQIKK